jgi:hypothetical protein
MGLGNIAEKMDDVLQRIHQYVADRSLRHLGLSNYFLSKAITISGIATMQAALVIFILDAALFKGSWLTAILAVFVDLLYINYYVGNLTKARIAEANEAFLKQQALASVIHFETRLQKSYYAVTVTYYIGSMVLIPGLAIVTSGLSTALKIAGTISLVFATSCIYNARYMLHAIPHFKGANKKI